MFTTCGFSRSRANIWEFPTLVKYRFAAIPGTFVTAGPSFRHVGKGEGTSESYRTGQLVAGEQVDYTIRRSTYYQPSETSLGFTGGAGLEYRTLGLNVSFDARYTRWASAYWEELGSHGYFKRSNPNQAEFLLGLTF